MNPEMKLGEGISISQGKEFQLMSSWMPITPEKPISTRSNPVPVDRYGTPLGRADWQELAGLPSGHIEEKLDYNKVVLNSSPIGQCQNEGYNGSNTSVAERRRIINHIAASYKQAHYHENGGWKNNQLANLLPRGYAAVLTSANRIPIRSTSIVNQPLDLNLHSQVNNWRDSNSGNLLLHNQAYHSSSNLLQIHDSFHQTQHYGFPITYQSKYKHNSPPRVEVNAASNATTTLPFSPVTLDTLKKLENNQLSKAPNLPTAESSNKEKDKQDNVVMSTGIEPTQNDNELLQNVLSSIISTPLEEKRDSKDGNHASIDLNKTPKQKPDKRRKHRPKVAREGKPKRTPKAKTPTETNIKEKPGGKRKYVRRKGLEESAMQKVDITRDTTDPSVGPVARSCRRALNFDLEKNGDGSQDEVIGQQAEMQQSYKRTFNLNVEFQATELNRTSGRCVPQSTMLIHQQNGLTIENKHPGTVNSHTPTVNQIPAYMPMQERQAISASVPPRTDLHMENPHVIASNVDTRIANPFKESSRNGYTTIQQHSSARETGHTIFQAKTNVEHLERTRELMFQTTLQSALKIRSSSKEARGSKREYSHTMEQPQPHTVNITGSSFLSQLIHNRDKCYRNACMQGADCSERRKKTKIDGLHTIITAKPSGMAMGKDGSRQAQVKIVNDVKGNGFILQANYDMLNSPLRSNSIDDRENGGYNKLFSDWNANSMASGHNLPKDISSVNHSCTVNMGGTNRLATVHAFASSIPSNRCNLFPPTPPSKAPAPGDRLPTKTCCANVSVKQNQKRNSTKSVSSEMDQGLLEQGETLFDHQQYSAKKGGLAIQKIYPISVDEIIHRFKSLNLNGIANQVQDQVQNAIVPYKQDGTVVPYEGFEFIKKHKPRPKVDLDPETNRIWNLLMGKEGSEGLGEPNKEKEKWWEEERRVFKGRADSFIARMHLVQGDRRFSKWKGSVVDSVVGVFLTQNVSDHLSSSAFMSLAARFPPKPNKRTNMDGKNILVEEPDVCVLSPNDTIQWHEQVVSHPLNSQSSITPYEPTEYQKESEGTWMDKTSLLEAHSHGLEEEIISSQDSFCSSILQSSGGIQSYSGSNSEVEDSPPGFKLDNGSTNFLQVGNATLFQGFYSCAKESTQFQERHRSQQLEHTQNLQQEPGLDSLDILESSLTFTELLNFNHPQNQAPLVPSCNYLSHMNTYSKLLGAEGSEIYSGECISSWPSITSEFPKAKDGNYSRTGQPVEDEGETTVQQNGSPRPKEMPTVSSYALLNKHTTQQQNFSQPQSHSKYNQPYSDIYQHEKNRNFECESISLGEPVHHSEAVAKEHISITQHLPSGPQLVDNNFDVGKRISEANKLSVDKLIKPNSGEQVFSTDKAYAETNPKISKSKKGKADTEKKNAIDWDSLRKQVQSNREKERREDTMDSLDYEGLRQASVKDISDVIKERGMNNMLAERIKEFLNRLVKEHKSIDLEWLRDVPPDQAKDYLLSIRGLGLKSVECVRLLTLHHLAFPVDTNVGRIAVRLGWVPLQPLPESLQLHLLELYPILESIQKYLWPRLCKLDQRTLYELHYQLITFGKVFCTKSKPNCNACPMRGECRHFASAFASARLALPGPEEKSIVSSTMPTTVERNPAMVINPMPLPSPEKKSLKEAGHEIGKCEPIIEEPATPEQECAEISGSDIEDTFYEDPDEIPTIKLNIEEFTVNLQNYMQEKMELQECDMSKALVALNPEAASLPAPKLKNMSRLRTEHQVYELPDSHPLLERMDRREPDDPSPYLLALWTPGETANSIQPPESRCRSQESGKLCNNNTCFSCNSIREANSQIVRGTLLIPCRTAMRGSFPLNGTYFQVNEVFADQESSLNPIDVPREWIWNLPRRMVYFGTSVSTIFKGLSTEGIQYCFWKGFVCVRGFDQKSRAPRPLMARLHFPASKLAKAKNENKS